MPREQRPSAALADRIYEQHVRPLEAAHMGEYALVTADGLVVLIPTLVEAAWRAAQAPSKKNFIFKVGTKSVGKLRRSRPSPAQTIRNFRLPATGRRDCSLCALPLAPTVG